MSLHPIVGHEELRGALATSFARGTLPSSLLLHGPRGVGKQRLALWIAQLAVCSDPGPDGPCGHCGPCRMSLHLEHPDIHWYFPLKRPTGMSRERLVDALEEARHRELAEIREDPVRPSWSDDVQAIYLAAVSNLRSQASKRPSMAPGPVFIVGQAEQLVPQEASQEAANALLKLLEEPPGDARFILTSSEPGLLLPTIVSRSVPLHVPPLPPDRVEAFLVEHRSVDARTARWASDLGQGSIGRALAFLEDEEGELGPLEQLRRRAFEIVTAALSGDPASGHELAASFPPAGARSLLDLFAFVESWLRDFAAVASDADALVFNRDAVPRMKKLIASSALESWRIPDAFPSVERARELARGNVNPQLVVSGLVRDVRSALLSAPSAALR